MRTHEGHDGDPDRPSQEERAAEEALERTLRRLGPLLGQRTQASGPRRVFVAALRHRLLATWNGGAAPAGEPLPPSAGVQRPPDQGHGQGHTAAGTPRRALALVLLVMLGGAAVILARTGQTQEGAGTHGG